MRTLRFSIIFLALAFHAAAGPAEGAVSGRVSYQGPVPKYPVPDNAGHREDLFHVNDANAGIEGTVVFLTRADGTPLTAPEPRGSSETGSSELDYGIDQFDYRFVPHVSAIRAGESVTFSSTDPGNHNVRATAHNPANEFNINTTPSYQYDRRFHAEPDGEPIALSCDIHAWMHAWLYVFDHPWYAVTDTDGYFQIPHVPAGDYRVHVRQPDGQLEATGLIHIGPGELIELNADFLEKHLGSREVLALESG